jgi:GntR family transcriptional regulator
MAKKRTVKRVRARRAGRGGPPLYFQIESDLRRLIASGELASGSFLPPETQLCRSYGVSRHTMRAALARLTADGLISRRAGRGTIVNALRDRVRFGLDRSFTRQMADMGRRANSRVLTCEVARVSGDSPQALRRLTGSTCLRLVRVRLGDDEPIAVQDSTVAMEGCPGIERRDFAGESLYDVLAREYKLAIARIDYAIGAAAADATLAGHLGIEAGDPLLVVRTTSYLAGRQPVEHTVSHYRADRYEYSTTHAIESGG